MVGLITHVQDVWPLSTAGLLFLAMGWVVHRELRKHLMDQEAARLRAQAKPIIDRRLEHLDGQVPRRELATILAMDLTNRDTTAMVIDRNGAVLSTGPPIEGPMPPLLTVEEYAPALRGEPHATYRLKGSDGQHLLVALVPPLAWQPQPPAIVQLTTDFGAEERVLRRFVWTLFTGASVIFIVAILLGYVFGGPFELLSLSCIPLVAAAARAAWERARPDGLVSPERLTGPFPLASPSDAMHADFSETMRRTEAAVLAARASEERMRRFVADASHELGTPLTSIGSAADLLLAGVRDHPEDLERLATLIRAQADRMGRLVEDLLTLARLDLGDQIRLEPVRLDRLVAEHAEELALAATDRRIETEVGRPVVVEGDEDRLRQVLANLTSNAVRHTYAGGLIRIAIGRENGIVVVEVTDDGQGISEQDLPRIFDRFYRADPARSEGGTGLGLAIVAETVRRLRGTVEATGSPGHGATLRIRLPDPARDADVSMAPRTHGHASGSG